MSSAVTTRAMRGGLGSPMRDGSQRKSTVTRLMFSVVGAVHEDVRVDVPPGVECSNGLANGTPSSD